MIGKLKIISISYPQWCRKMRRKFPKVTKDHLYKAWCYSGGGPYEKPPIPAWSDAKIERWLKKKNDKEPTP